MNIGKCCTADDIETLVKGQDFVGIGEIIKVIDCDAYFYKIEDNLFYKIPNENLFRVIKDKDYSFKGEC